jgi:hypothetical protein
VLASVVESISVMRAVARSSGGRNHHDAKRSEPSESQQVNIDSGRSSAQIQRGVPLNARRNRVTHGIRGGGVSVTGCVTRYGVPSMTPDHATRFGRYPRRTTAAAIAFASTTTAGRNSIAAA